VQEYGTDAEFTRAIESFGALLVVVPVAGSTRVIGVPDGCGDYGDEGECEGDDGDSMGEENSVSVGL
jgi:hypothetical protein